MAEIAERVNGIYTINKLRCVSVTTVLGQLDKPFLYRWYAKNGWDACEKIKNDSCNIGKYVDDYVISHLTGAPLNPYTETNSELVAKKDLAVKNFNSFVATCQPTHVMSQQLVYWDKEGEETAGTLDAVVKVGGRNILVDWKVANQISDTYVLQIQTYLAFLNHNVEQGILKLDSPIEDLWIVRFDKEKEFKFERDVTQMKPDAQVFDTFLQLRRAYEGMKHVRELLKRRK